MSLNTRTVNSGPKALRRGSHKLIHPKRTAEMGGHSFTNATEELPFPKQRGVCALHLSQHRTAQISDFLHNVTSCYTPSCGLLYQATSKELLEKLSLFWSSFKCAFLFLTWFIILQIPTICFCELCSVFYGS